MKAEIAGSGSSRLLERELLRESHHRIANHLSLLVAMIRTQNAAVRKGPVQLTRETVAGMLTEIAAKVVATGQLHRRLIDRPATTTVDLSNLLIKSCTALSTSLSLTERVRFRYALIAACQVKTEEATALGFIVSEIVMNAIKYAHPAGQHVEISISAGVTERGRPVIEVADDGVGLPAGFDEARDGGSGFKILRCLVQKIGAKLTFRSCDLGLSFRIVLPWRPAIEYGTNSRADPFERVSGQRLGAFELNANAAHGDLLTLATPSPPA